MLRDDITQSLKTAMKGQDKIATSTLRLILAAIKDRDIAARGKGERDGDGNAAAVESVIAETSADSLKDMGRTMALLRERHAGQMDFGKASGLIKTRLTGG